MPDASVSAHVDEEFLSRFDETFDCGPGRERSRSEAIEHAMKWAVAMERARQNVGWDYENWHAIRAGTPVVWELADRYERLGEDA